MAVNHKWGNVSERSKHYQLSRHVTLCVSHSLSASTLLAQTAELQSHRCHTPSAVTGIQSLSLWRERENKKPRVHSTHINTLRVWIKLTGEWKLNVFLKLSWQIFRAIVRRTLTSSGNYFFPQLCRTSKFFKAVPFVYTTNLESKRIFNFDS